MSQAPQRSARGRPQRKQGSCEAHADVSGTPDGMRPATGQPVAAAPQPTVTAPRRGKLPKRGRLMNEAAIAQSTDLVGIVPNDAPVAWQVATTALQQNGEWPLHCRSVPPCGLQTVSETVPTPLSTVPCTAHRGSLRPVDRGRALRHEWPQLAASPSLPLYCQQRGAAHRQEPSLSEQNASIPSLLPSPNECIEPSVVMTWGEETCQVQFAEAEPASRPRD